MDLEEKYDFNETKAKLYVEALASVMDDVYDRFEEIQHDKRDKVKKPEDYILDPLSDDSPEKLIARTRIYFNQWAKGQDTVDEEFANNYEDTVNDANLIMATLDSQYGLGISGTSESLFDRVERFADPEQRLGLDVRTYDEVRETMEDDETEEKETTGFLSNLDFPEDENGKEWGLTGDED